ncbi:MAG TPA: GAF domain-containing protein [Anaerolineae bacterium]|nr:GAF domain-containing protein [Anaerolineae bacterium]
MSDVAVLEAAIEEAGTGAERAAALNALAWAVVRQDRERAVALCMEAEQLAEELEDWREMAASLRTRSLAAAYGSEYGVSLATAERALDILDNKVQAPELLPDVLNMVASMYRKLGNVSEALDYQLRQMKMSEELGDRQSYGRALIGMGLGYYDLEEFEETLVYFEKSLKVFRTLEDSYWIALALNNVSGVATKLGLYDKGLATAEEGVAIAQKDGHQRMEMTLYNTLAEAYFAMEDYEQARIYAEKALPLAIDQNQSDAHINGLRMVGRVLIAEGDCEAALRYLEEALQLAEGSEALQLAYLAHEELANAHKALGNFELALKHYEQFHQLKESIFNEESSQKLRNLEVLYQTEAARQEATYYADLYSSEQTRQKLTEILQELGQALLGQMNLSEVLNTILAQLGDLIAFKRGAVLLWREEMLVPVAVWPEVVGMLAPLRRPQIEGMAFGELYKDKVPLFRLNTANYAQEPSLASYFGEGAWLGVPLLRQDEVIGVVTLARDEERPFSDEAIQMTVAIAAQTAVTIENTRLYQQSEQRSEALTTLSQVGQDILGSLDLQVVLERLAHHAHRLFNAIQTVLWLREGYTAWFEATVAIGDYSEEIRADKMRLGEGFAGSVALRGEAEIINDMETDYRGKHVPGTPEVEDTPAAVMCVPLQTRGKTIGVLALYRQKADGRFTQTDLDFLIGLGRQAVIAIENARLYAQVQAFNEQLEQEVALRTADLQIAYEQLERLDRTKSDFIQITAHELRTPITVLQGYGQLLERDPLFKGHEYQQNLVEGMVKGAQRMHEIVNTMLMMIKVDSRSLVVHPEPLAISRVVKAVVEDLEANIKSRKQVVEIGDELGKMPLVTGDIEALVMVMQNLLTNAIKYTPDGGEITIKSHYYETDSPLEEGKPAVEVLVTDTGIGISAEAIDLIFTKFYQTGEVANHSSSKTQFKGGGPGLGLAIARGIVEAHEGRLWAESAGYDEENLPGSTFHVVLPVAQELVNEEG